MEMLIRFSMDNAAFNESPSEIQDILRVLGRKLANTVASELEGWEVPIFDSNGTRVGTAKVNQ